MDNTPNLVLPYIQAAQAQKHITHNEAIRGLDAIVQISVVDRDLSVPPGSPVEGHRYLVASSPSGAWSGHAGKIAAWQDGAWMFYAPKAGWVAYVADEGILIVYSGSAWNAVSSSSSVALLGINATADTTNRLSVSSTASLFNHVGNGHQAKLNKNGAGDTASFLFQTGFSGRAEMGTTGDDDFHFKVSPGRVDVDRGADDQPDHRPGQGPASRSDPVDFGVSTFCRPGKGQRRHRAGLVRSG